MCMNLFRDMEAIEMRLGVIGLGNMGSNHVKVCCKVNDASLVGCCDIDR